MGWRDQIVKAFVSDLTRITLVADPDGLLSEEKIQAHLREHKFEVLSYEDPIAFRYEYEMRFRSYWDQDQTTDLVIALRAEQDNLDNLPYDLLQKGRRLSFSLQDFFPGCHPGVLAQLDKSDLDKLEKALIVDQPGNLGRNATIDFLSRHLFQFDSATVNSPAILLSKLLSIHYEGIELPPLVSSRLVQRLQQSHPLFCAWPLEKILPSRTLFFQFLQERWPIFLSKLNSDNINEPQPEYGLSFPGPVDLPFEHSEVKIKLDNCFADGLLTPITLEGCPKKLEPWMQCGIKATKSIAELNT